jgi:hypothetical protein
MADLKPVAVFPVAGVPDWQVVTEDAVWVSNGPEEHAASPRPQNE